MGTNPTMMPGVASNSRISSGLSAGRALAPSPMGTPDTEDLSPPQNRGNLQNESNESEGVMPDHLVPIGNTPFYTSPVEPVDPWDCDRWANNLACGSLRGISLDPRPHAEFDFSSSNLGQLLPYFRDRLRGSGEDIPIIDVCVAATPSVGFFNLPTLDFCYSSREWPDIPPSSDPPQFPAYPRGPLRRYPQPPPGNQICQTKVKILYFEWRYNGEFYVVEKSKIGQVPGQILSWSVRDDPEEVQVIFSLRPPDPLTLRFPQGFIDHRGAGSFSTAGVSIPVGTHQSGVMWPFGLPEWDKFREHPEYEAGKGLKRPSPFLEDAWIPDGCGVTTYYWPSADGSYQNQANQDACGLCLPQRMPVPPTPIYPPMSCCPQTEELLRRIAKRIGIAEREANDKYPITVPIDLTQDDDETIDFETIPEVLVWQAQQIDSLLGQFPSKVKLKVEDENGQEQEQTVTLHNVAETLTELFGMIYTTMYDVDVSQHMLSRIVSELIATKNAAIIAGDIAFASNEFLGGNIKKKKKEVASAFDIENSDDMHKFLSNGKYEIQTWINDDKNTAINYFQELMFAASIIKAVFYRQQPIEQSELLKEIFQTAAEEDAASNLDWDRFMAAIENPQGRAAVTRLRRDIDEIQEEEEQ